MPAFVHFAVGFVFGASVVTLAFLIGAAAAEAFREPR